MPRNVTVTSLMGRRCVVMLPKGWTKIVVHQLRDAMEEMDREVYVYPIGRDEFVGKTDVDRLFGFDTEKGASYSLTDGSV